MIKQIAKKLETARHIVLILHVNPDADSFGSASAFYSYILRLQKKVTLFCATSQPDKKLAQLPWFSALRQQFPKSADLALCFDCGSVSRLGHHVECELINIDHHSSNSNFGNLNIVNTDAISTTQIIYELFKEGDIKINTKMATALYAGLLDDSNCFLHSKTDANSFIMAADLLRCGAQSQDVSDELYNKNSLASLRLKGLMFERLELHCSGALAVLHVNLEMLKSSGATAQDSETALEEALCLATVKVSLLLRERSDGSIKGSLRGDGSVNLVEFVKDFDGGGHRERSGFVVEDGTICALENKIINKLCKELN
ncbi:MAG: bifunctional oligoribonuclease/PAP phosphatase NrnA [Campylobacterota bacterium]|nr:bifunctional oligoribonuclease/PAP phosphatase NrnA [Campylobacterota bacterium]